MPVKTRRLTNVLLLESINPPQFSRYSYVDRIKLWSLLWQSLLLGWTSAGSRLRPTVAFAGKPPVGKWDIRERCYRYREKFLYIPQVSQWDRYAAGKERVYYLNLRPNPFSSAHFNLLFFFLPAQAGRRYVGWIIYFDQHLSTLTWFAGAYRPRLVLSATRSGPALRISNFKYHRRPGCAVRSAQRSHVRVLFAPSFKLHNQWNLSYKRCSGAVSIWYSYQREREREDQVDIIPGQGSCDTISRNCWGGQNSDYEPVADFLGELYRDTLMHPWRYESDT